MKQDTGFLYTVGNNSGFSVVASQYSATNVNRGGVLYNVWDPWEHAVSYSGTLQAEDFTKEQTKYNPPRQLTLQS